MSLLSSLTSDASIADEKDVLGGGGARVLDTGIYRSTVELAYLQKSTGGALGLFLHFKTEDGRELRTSQYLTSGTAKGGKNYYEKDGEKHYLPGYNLGNSLAQLTTGKEIGQLEHEEKVVKLYNFEAKAEVPTKVEVITELLGQEIYVAVHKQIADKNVKDAAGNYIPSGDTREENELDKFFCAKESFDKLTAAEIKAKRGGAEITEPFYNQWLEKNTGKVRDRSTKGATGTAGAPKGAAAATPAAGKPSASLFS